MRFFRVVILCIFVCQSWIFSPIAPAQAYDGEPTTIVNIDPTQGGLADSAAGADRLSKSTESNCSGPHLIW